jgi:DNA anti-recombination protein RmuC
MKQFFYSQTNKHIYYSQHILETIFKVKIALDYQYQIFKKIKDSIEKDQINKIRSMLEPIIQKQSRDAKRQLEIINQLQYQLKQLQKQVSDIQKSMRRTKKKDR